MTTRFSDPRLVPDKTVSMMNQADRKALGLKTVEERQGKAEEMAEKELQRLCEQELSRRGIAYLHLSFRAREKKGWPDLTFVLPKVRGECGTPWAVELKTASGVLTNEQKTMFRAMNLNGWCTCVIRSFEDFREILEADL